MNTAGELIELIVRLYEGRLINRDKYRGVLVAMCLTVKGLTRPEILSLVDSK